MTCPSDLELALLALTIRESTGRDLAKVYKARYGKTLSYGSLYTTLRRMADQGWINVREGEDEDGRFRWYIVTGKGQNAYEQGIEQRKRTLRLAGLQPEGEL